MSHWKRALKPNPAYPNDSGWKTRHELAVESPRGFEVGMLALFAGLYDYAWMHQHRYESPIGNDGVLGREWRDMAKSLRGLLNGDCGRLDCGTLDAAICNLAADHGIDLEK